jgi:hypothetical protein
MAYTVPALTAHGLNGQDTTLHEWHIQFNDAGVSMVVGHNLARAGYTIPALKRTDQWVVGRFNLMHEWHIQFQRGLNGS